LNHSSTPVPKGNPANQQQGSMDALGKLMFRNYFQSARSHARAVFFSNKKTRLFPVNSSFSPRFFFALLGYFSYSRKSIYFKQEFWIGYCKGDG